MKVQLKDSSPIYVSLPLHTIFWLLLASSTLRTRFFEIELPYRKSTNYEA
jgi:hypothetical protein